MRNVLLFVNKANKNTHKLIHSESYTTYNNTIQAILFFFIEIIVYNFLNY